MPKADTAALTAALASARQTYIKTNPASAAAFESAKRAGIAGGTNRASIFYKPFPLTFVDAEAATAVTADGQSVTDFLGNYTAGLFGFSPQPVIDAVTSAMANGHALGGAANKIEANVARALVNRFKSIDMVRFCNTGSEANTYAMNTARAVTGREKFLMYEGAYHGAWIHGGDLALDIPYNKIYAPYGDADQICRLIEENASELAAFIMEPVMVNPQIYLKQLAPSSYLKQIRDTCSRAGCALIFDEVMTSRLAPGGAQELVDVEPDLTTFGKYFGGGMPFGGFGGKREWMNRHDPDHPRSINSGGTFNQNALCLAAVDSVLSDLWTPEQCREHNAMGDNFREEINKLSEFLRVPCQAVGTGSLITLIWQCRSVFQTSATEGHKQPLDIAKDQAVGESTQLFWFHMLAEHSILAGSPRLNYLTLPVTLKKEDYQRFLAGIEDFAQVYRAELNTLAAATA
jgi:glutamate-1-semialdehyde 2,1-aminomutase